VNSRYKSILLNAFVEDASKRSRGFPNGLIQSTTLGRSGMRLADGPKALPVTFQAGAALLRFHSFNPRGGTTQRTVFSSKPAR